MPSTPRPWRSQRGLPLVRRRPAQNGFEALLVFHYTITAINELREPLHDEVVANVFRVEGKGSIPWKDDFGRSRAGSEFHPIKSSSNGMI